MPSGARSRKQRIMGLRETHRMLSSEDEIMFPSDILSSSEDEDDNPFNESLNADMSLAAKRTTSKRKQSLPAIDFDYNYEQAYKNGHAKVEEIRRKIMSLRLDNALRTEVWQNDISTLQDHKLPSPLIALYGVSGAGKSSLLNAILDDNIVPTSGMDACTAVATEIQFHALNTIEAEIVFLSEEEWKVELEALLIYFRDENGAIEEAASHDGAGPAWSKVKAVYPSIKEDLAGGLTVDQILARYPAVQGVLDTTKRIVATDSAQFGAEITKYVDSQGAGRPRDKRRKQREKGKGKAKLQTARDQNAVQAADLVTPDEHALWPLIRQVKVWCKADALSTGAILVDLPGVSDSNQARVAVAQDYLKKCDCIWILSEIIRASADKVANDLLRNAFISQATMDGNFNADGITFIVSKTDNISSEEIIDRLVIDDHPVLNEIEDRIEEFSDQMREWKDKEDQAIAKLERIESKQEDLERHIANYESHLETLGFPSEGASTGQKRVRVESTDASPSKRQKSTAPNDSDDLITDGEETDSDDEMDDGYSEVIGSSTSTVATSQGAEEQNQDFLQGQLKRARMVRDGLEKSVGRIVRKKEDAANQRRAAAERRTMAQRDKDCYCSIERSKIVRYELQRHFRAEMERLHRGATSNRNGSASESHIRNDSNSINLPVFAVSSQDYRRITKLLKSEVPPSVFTDPKDTGIPALRKWCQILGDRPREQSVRDFLTQITSLAASVQNYLEEMGEVTTADRQAMRSQWHSGTLGYFPSSQKKGITPRLVKTFVHIVGKCGKDLKTKFRDGLEDECEEGSQAASSQALTTYKEFERLPWQTYRAMLRRYGVFNRDLNRELVEPFTGKIAATWANVFESDLLGPFETAILDAVDDLLEDVTTSAPPTLEERVGTKSTACRVEAQAATHEFINVVKKALRDRQREISRRFAEHVQTSLAEGYECALEETGTGRGAATRQKDAFREYLEENRDIIFDGGKDIIMHELDDAADGVAKQLTHALRSLARKCEASLSSLWQSSPQDEAQRRAQKDVLRAMQEVLEQVEIWQEADRARPNSPPPTFWP